MKINNSPIHYFISDKRFTQTILFVHSAFADHSQFENQVDYFRDNYNVITLDLIGHGLSTNTKNGDSIERTAEYIKDILIAENIATAHLVGVSIGAILVQDFANKHPEMVVSLCCIGGYDINHFDAKMQKENSAAQMLLMFRALFSIRWFARCNMKISAYTLEAQKRFYQMNIRFPRKSFMYLAGLGKLVNKHTSAHRNYPLLIGCGEKDIPMALKLSNIWHNSESQSQLLIFNDSGHLVNMDVPDQFNIELEKFIKSV